MGRLKYALLLAMVATLVTADDWSWGAEDETVNVAPSQDTLPSSQLSFRDGKSVEVSPQDFKEPLPLEPHQVGDVAIIDGEASQRTPSLQQEEGDRQARFLGLSETFCNWGIGSYCKNKIKNKKGHGYAPSIDSHYGVPAVGGYETLHGSSSYSDYDTFNTYDTNVKDHKKKNGGVTDLISGFLTSYTKPKPKPTKGYAISQLPTYIAPGPLPTYGAPIKPALPTYVAPQPSYGAPAYSPPKFATPKSVYKLPAPSYNPPTYIKHDKPKIINIAPKVTKVITQTVRPHHEATKVQHLHSHTHVYHGAKVVKPGSNGYSNNHQVHHAPSNGYSNSHFQKKSDEGTILADSSNGNFNNANNFGSGSSFSSTSFNSGIQGSHSSNVQHQTNPFNNIPLPESNVHGSGSGFSTHSTLSTNNHNFQSQTGFQNKFNPSTFQQGFQPSTTIEDMINHNHIGSFARTLYKFDCQCVSAQYCTRENIVPRNGDFGHLIDARNEQNLVYSNDTDSSENATATDGDYDYYDTTVSPYSIEEEDSPVDDGANGTVSERRRRDVLPVQTEEEENYSDVEGRQLSGYTPGPNGCGAGTVCCRRPVYNPARSLPVCGISHDENIHGRIKTKHDGVGQASFGEYPWQAAILKRSGSEMVYVCGATLVSDQYLITAAHCVKELDASVLKVRLGEWDVRAKTEFYPHVEFRVSGMYTHPEFYEGNLENDITVLRIEERINFSKYPHIGPACLPPTNVDFTGQVCRITGWGKDGWGSEGKFQAILKETDVPVIRKDVCEQVLKGTKLGPTYSLHKGMMCAGGEENKDACKGDGGGPLVCKASTGEYHLAGVVSWGIGCGERGVPGVYVDVPYYSEWIQSIIRN